MSGILSDVIRFTNDNGILVEDDTSGPEAFLASLAHRMIYYSDIGEDEDAPADTGFPVSLVPNDLGGIVENGTEGNNGFVWNPPVANANVYIGVSDGVIPEPASLIVWSLLGLGSVFGVCVWRRRSTDSI